MEPIAQIPDDRDAIPSWRQGPDRQQIAEKRVRAEFREIANEFAVVIETGDAADAIMRTAENYECGLIVTGVARNERLGRISLGSTVMRLTRRSQAPVLVVRKRGRRPYREIVVATDFSDSSRHALVAAARFFPGQDLSLFHAYDTPLSTLATNAAVFCKQFEDAARTECEAFLKATDLTGRQGPSPRILLENGEPDQLLHDYVSEKGVDLVALGTHGRGAMFQALTGSVAHRLIDVLPCDVLIVRESRATTGA